MRERWNVKISTDAGLINFTTSRELLSQLTERCKKEKVDLLQLLTRIYHLYGKLNPKVIREYLWTTEGSV